jgi:hypothetical protein
MPTDPWSEVKPTVRGKMGGWWQRFLRRRQQAEHDWIYGTQPKSTVPLRQPPPAPKRPTVVFTAVLPSAVPHAEFTATCTVAWEAIGETTHAKPESIARSDIERRAAEVLAKGQVTHCEQLQHKLEAELGYVTKLEDARIAVQLVEIELTCTDESRAATELYQELQRRRLVRGWDRDLKLDELRHLKDDILSDPAMATVWWLQNNDNQVDQAVEMSAKLRKLAQIMTENDERSTTDTVASLVDRFVDRLPDGARWRLLSNLAEVFSHYGSPDLASELPELDGGGGQHRPRPAHSE